MAKTCNCCHGHSDDYNEADLKLCAGCRKVYYCSRDCQKYDWVEHIFDCKPRRSINTADYLARAVRRNLFPDHLQTCEDYGFSRALTEKESVNLFGLYIGLIEFMRIPPQTIHGWRIRGVLVDEIKAAFYKKPEEYRGGYFPWFLQNEHIIALAGQPLPAEAYRDNVDAMVVRAWRFIGGSERDSPDEISAALERLPDEERDCHQMYTLLLSNSRPAPVFQLFVDFGFASCTSQEEEMMLSATYLSLIKRCTFEEFCDAYRTGRMSDLISDAKPCNRHLFDILQELPRRKKSVWYLKQFLLQEDDPEPDMHYSAEVDYGFRNCKSDSERRQLRRVYKAYFDKHDGDPLELHEAAMQGNLHGYLSNVVEGLRDPKFRRLMKNPHPARGL